jgi:hypothetical protein
LTETTGAPQCLPSGPDECSSVEFDYPSMGTVHGTLGEATDGG